MSELDKRRVRVSFDRAARDYDKAALLQREIGDRLLARLDLLKAVPLRVLDVGSGSGYCTHALTRRYPRATVIGIDLAPAMAGIARGRRRWFSRSPFIAGDAEALPIADASIDMVFTNLMLQWCNPDRVFKECARVLRPGGVLMFTSFGPDTLRELRSAWRQVDDHVHVHDFVDMHDIGDALVRAGLADPVVDVERLTATYADVAGVLRDLKQIGAHNAATDRAAGLTGKARFARFRTAYEAMRVDGRIPATYEVVYGHAWGAGPSQHSRPDGAVAIPLASLRRSR